MHLKEAKENLINKKQKKSIAERPIVTQQSGNSVVKAVVSKATAKSQQVERKDDPTAPLNSAKNSEESVNTMNLGKTTTGKTPLKDAASTDCPGIERVDGNDIRGVTVDTEHTPLW